MRVAKASVVLLLAVSLHAQTSRGTVTGTVLEVTGGANLTAGALG